jgi:hypothetical protein
MRAKRSPLGFVIVLIGALLVAGGLMRLDSSAAAWGIDDLIVSVTACTSAAGSPAVAEVLYTVANRGVTTRDARLRIEYVDANGARLGTDLSRVAAIPAGTSVQSGESTVLRTRSRSVRCRVRAIP